MPKYGVVCPHCRSALSVEFIIATARIGVSLVGTGRVKPGITADLEPTAATFTPAQPPPSNGGQRAVCNSCHQPGQRQEGVARSNGRGYTALKCATPDCPMLGQLLPGTFRWLAAAATV